MFKFFCIFKPSFFDRNPLFHRLFDLFLFCFSGVIPYFCLNKRLLKDVFFPFLSFFLIVLLFLLWFLLFSLYLVELHLFYLTFLFALLAHVHSL